MGKFVRKTKEERMLEIRSSALDIFILKGYKATTMDDIVHSVNMSKGSVYRYYPHKYEILTDLLKDGINIRNDVIFQYVINENVSEEIVATVLSELFFSDEADGKYAKLYVIFLYEKMFDNDLENVYKNIMSFGMSSTDYLDIINLDKLMKIVTIMNTFILGKVVLHKDFNFFINKELIYNIFLTILKGE